MYDEIIRRVFTHNCQSLWINLLSITCMLINTRMPMFRFDPTLVRYQRYATSRYCTQVIISMVKYVSNPQESVSTDVVVDKKNPLFANICKKTWWSMLTFRFSRARAARWYHTWLRYDTRITKFGVSVETDWNRYACNLIQRANQCNMTCYVETPRLFTHYAFRPTKRNQAQCLW